MTDEEKRIAHRKPFIPQVNCPTPIHMGSTWLSYKDHPCTVEGLQAARRDFIVEHYGDDQLTKRKFTIGQLVIVKIRKSAYYLEDYPEYDFMPGETAVLASYGGPCFCVVDKIVDGIVLRTALEFVDIGHPPKEKSSKS